MGAMGLCTTANDFFKFQQMLRRGGKAPDGTRVVQPENVNMILQEETGRARLWANVSCAPFFNTPTLSTVCLKNDAESSKSYSSHLGYGLGVVRTLGFKSKTWYHGGNMGFLNWLPDDHYTALFTTGYPNIFPAVFAWQKVLYAFEAQNFNQTSMCPFASLKLDSMDNPILSSLPDATAASMPPAWLKKEE